jgi:hypothetical protein
MYKWVDYMNIELAERRHIYRIETHDINEIQTPFLRSVSEGSDVSLTEIPFVRYVSDEELYFEQMNRENLERYMLLWHLRYYNAYNYHMFYRTMWNIPPPPNYVPIIHSR